MEIRDGAIEDNHVITDVTKMAPNKEEMGFITLNSNVFHEAKGVVHLLQIVCITIICVDNGVVGGVLCRKRGSF